MSPRLVAVMGPTASGKTELAEALAERLGAGLVNADAFQMYRGLDVGTGKPERRALYALLDTLDPCERYGAGRYVRDARAVLAEFWRNGRSAVLVGGTGLYVRALTEEYTEMAEAASPARVAEVARWEQEEGLEGLVRRLRPEVAARLDVRNPARVRRALEREGAEPLEASPLPPFRVTKLALVPSVEETRTRVLARVVGMVQNGWVEEVAGLRSAGYVPSDPGFRAIGYAEMWDVLAGERDLGEAIVRVQEATIRYAKRQRTWLRSEPRVTPIPFGHAEVSLERALSVVLQEN